MNRRGVFYPPRSDWLPQRKRPQATPGRLIIATVRNESCREDGAPWLHRSPLLGGILGVHQTTQHIALKKHASSIV